MPFCMELDFFQYEAWVHASVPRVACTACGKTSQVPVPWARAGTGFTLLFEALALSLCKELPVAHAARHLRTDAKALWRRIEHYVNEARAQDDMSQVRHIGIDETSVRKGYESSPSCTTSNKNACSLQPRGETTRRCRHSPRTWPRMGAAPRPSSMSAWT